VILCCVFLYVGQNKKLVPIWSLVGLLYLNIKQLSFIQKMSAKKEKGQERITTAIKCKISSNTLKKNVEIMTAMLHLMQYILILVI
jgi:hypothetical protein